MAAEADCVTRAAVGLPGVLLLLLLRLLLAGTKGAIATPDGTLGTDTARAPCWGISDVEGTFRAGGEETAEAAEAKTTEAIDLEDTDEQEDMEEQGPTPAVLEVAGSTLAAAIGASSL